MRHNRPDFGALTAMEVDKSGAADITAISPDSAFIQIDGGNKNKVIAVDAAADFYPDKTNYYEAATEFDVMDYFSKAATDLKNEIEPYARDGIKIVQSLNVAKDEATGELVDSAKSASPSLAQKFQDLSNPQKLAVAAGGYMAMQMIPKKYLFGGLALFLFAKMKSKGETAQTQTASTDAQSTAPVAGMC